MVPTQIIGAKVGLAERTRIFRVQIVQCLECLGFKPATLERPSINPLPVSRPSTEEDARLTRIKREPVAPVEDSPF